MPYKIFIGHFTMFFNIIKRINHEDTPKMIHSKSKSSDKLAIINSIVATLCKDLPQEKMMTISELSIDWKMLDHETLLPTLNIKFN